MARVILVSLYIKYLFKKWMTRLCSPAAATGSFSPEISERDYNFAEEDHKMQFLISLHFFM